MNTINCNSKFLRIILCLLIWLPWAGVAQTEKFEMVVEKVDGTKLPFLITNDYPVLSYMYGGEDGVNTLEIQTAEGSTSVPCPEIKRLFTRVAENTPEPQKGDANDDGIVNEADIIEVVNYIMGCPSAKFNASAADANDDKTVNAADIVEIVNIIKGN